MGLVLYICAILVVIVKVDIIKNMFIGADGEVFFDIISNMPIVLLIIIIATALLTNLTCSMISLEGKSINILKSLPLRPIDIIMYKINTTLIVVVPVIEIGLIISIIKFKINIFIGLLLMLSGIILPLISGLIGIIVNLKFPKLDAKDDTEVVKQSMSSFISVMLGLFLTIMFIGGIFKLLELVNIYLVMVISTLIFLIIAYILYLYTKIWGTKDFEKLVV
jgi:ABC-2 type transport system permease protein